MSQQTVMIGGAVRCAEGQAGRVSGLLINPTRSHLDYLILEAEPRGEREYYIPSGLVEQIEPQMIRLAISWDALSNLPHPQPRGEQGTVQDNLPNLCIAHAGTPVLSSEGNPLGGMAGVSVDADLRIHAIVLDQSSNATIPVSSISNRSEGDEAVIVELANVA